MRATLYTLAIAALMTVPASAALVTNGDFETTAFAPGFHQLTPGNTTQLPGWVLTGGTSPIACVMFPADPTDCGASAPKLWAATVSPDGGNFFVMDIDNAAVLSQTISGLIVGQFYDIAFYQAGAEFAPQTGATFQHWVVGFGAQSKDSSNINTASKGFSGWGFQNLRFQATATSQVLSFLAVGGPGGLPPAIALDDVEVTLVPEPGTFALMGAALVMVGFARKRLTKRS